MSVEYAVVSIGTLSRNRLWNEGSAVRTAHATTTYVEDAGRRILVDPSLPGPILSARFNERTGKTAQDVTDVFCTTLRPVHRRAIEVFAGANWWVNQLELQSYRSHLETLLDSADRLNSEDAAAVEVDLKLLEQFKPAPDKFSPQISLYPLAGPSVGSAGLLLTPATSTIVIAGDAAVTAAHVRCGQVWQGCVDTSAAMDSLQDLVQIADVIIPGHDNLLLTPRQAWM